MRFVCDEMLGGLGKWLRAAGYDTVIAAGGLPDRDIAARCAAESRVLLTKDRHLAAAAAAIARVVVVAEGGIDEIAMTLRAALDLDWRRAPFTRCIADIHLLDPAPARAGVASAREIAWRRRPVAAVSGMRAHLLAGGPRPPHAVAPRELAKSTPCPISAHARGRSSSVR